MPQGLENMEDKDILRELLHDRMKPQGVSISDILMKIGTGVTTTCIMGVIIFLISLGTDVRLIQSNQVFEKEQRVAFQDTIKQKMKEFEDFADEPQFSERNFVERTGPIKESVIGNASRISEQNKAIHRLETNMRDMAEDITIIRMAVDPKYPQTRRKRK